MRARITCLLAALLVTLVAALAGGASPSLAAANDIPGTPIAVGATASGTLDASTKPRDVYAVTLRRGEEVRIAVTLSKAEWWPTCLYLASPSSKSFANGDIRELGRSDDDGRNQGITYTPAVDGVYYINVTADGMHGLTYGLSVSRTAAPAIVGDYAPDICGVAVGTGTYQGVVDAVTLPDNVYAVRLFSGEPVLLTLGLSKAEWWPTCLYLMAPSSTSIEDGKHTVLAESDDDGVVQKIVYTPAVDGTYYVDVKADGMTGVRYSLTVGGSAEKPRFRTRCFLHGPRTVRKGAAARLRARVVDPGLNALGQRQLTLYSSSDGRTWKSRGSAVSTAGSCVFRVTITRKMHFRVAFAGDSTFYGSRSRAIVVRTR